MKGKPRLDYTRFTCPVQNAVTLIGDKWTLFLLREFFYTGNTQRFNKLLLSLKPISSRTLSLKLKKMEQSGIVKREIIMERPIKIKYSLTKKGKGLEKALKEMANWFRAFESLSKEKYTH